MKNTDVAILLNRITRNCRKVETAYGEVKIKMEQMKKALRDHQRGGNPISKRTAISLQSKINILKEVLKNKRTKGII